MEPVSPARSDPFPAPNFRLPSARTRALMASCCALQSLVAARGARRWLNNRVRRHVKCAEVAKELLATEVSYYGSLGTLKAVFAAPLAELARAKKVKGFRAEQVFVTCAFDMGMRVTNTICRQFSWVC